MATFGYLIDLVRVNTPMRSREFNRLSHAGDGGADLLDLIEAQLTALGGGYHKEESSSEGYRLRHLSRRNRMLFLTINKGPEGATGETYDLDSGESTDTTERIALLSGLRAAVFVPADSYYGLLFVERIGLRNLKEVLRRSALRPAASQAGVTLRMESFAEAKDWKTLLEGRDTLRVSRLMRSSDSGADASTPEDTVVRISAEGSGVRKVSKSVRGLLADRFDRREQLYDLQADFADFVQERYAAGDDGLTVEDEARFQAMQKEVKLAEKGEDGASEPLLEALSSAIPVSAGAGLTHQQYEVGVGVDRPERTFVVERQRVPVFVYELTGRLSDDALVGAWRHHAETILKNRGVSLSPKWASQ